MSDKQAAAYHGIGPQDPVMMGRLSVVIGKGLYQQERQKMDRKQFRDQLADVVENNHAQVSQNNVIDKLTAPPETLLDHAARLGFIGTVSEMRDGTGKVLAATFHIKGSMFDLERAELGLTKEGQA